MSAQLGSGELSIEVVGDLLWGGYLRAVKCGQQSQQKKQRLEGIGRHQLGTAKGDFTDDI